MSLKRLSAVLFSTLALVPLATGDTAVAGRGAPKSTGPSDGVKLTYPIDPPIFRWGKVRKAVSYRIQIDDKPNFTGAFEFVTANTTYVPTVPQTAGQLFYWRVQAVLASGRSTSWSPSRTYELSWPTKPQLVTPESGALTEDVVLRWEPQLGAASYQLQISPNGDWANNLAIDQVVKGTGYSPPATLNNASYFWRVRGRDSASPPNLGNWSDEFQFMRSWDDRVTNPVTGDALGSPMLSWSPAEKASHYEIQIGYDANFSPGTFSSCFTNHTRWTFGELLPGNATTPLLPGTCRPPPCTPSREPSQYYWRVLGIDAPTGVKGLPSEVSEYPFYTGTCPGKVVTSMSQDVLSSSMYVRPCDGCTVGDTPTFMWTPVSGTSSYLLYIALDENFTNIVRSYKVYDPDRGSPWTTFTPRESLFDNQAGQSYYWFVRPCEQPEPAVRAPEICGSSDPAITSANAPSFRKTSPSVELEGAQTSFANQVTFDWQGYLQTNQALPAADPYQSPTQEAKQYRIQVSTTNDFSQLLDDELVDQTVYTPFDKTYPEGKLFWRLQAVDGSGNLLTASTVAQISKVSPRIELVSPKSRARVRRFTFFRWKPQSFAAGYQIEVYQKGDVHFSPANMILVQQTSLSAWAPPVILEPGRYAWRVRRIDVDHRPGPWSKGRRFTLR